MIRFGLAIAALVAAAGCGVKSAPTPAAPLWGERDRAPPEQVRAPQSEIEYEDARSIGDIGEPDFATDDDDEADDAGAP